MKGFALLALLLTPFAAQACQTASETQVGELFDRWNSALQSGDPGVVAATYHVDAVLLPTLSNQVRLTPTERLEYFQHFLDKRPTGRIVSRSVRSQCDTVLDAGVYEFTFAATGETVQARYSYTWDWDGKQWLIGSHHSSLMPQG